MDGLRENFVFSDSVREPTKATTPFFLADEASLPPHRIKAVRLPVVLIESVDDQRGNTSFSDFVTEAVHRYLK